MILMDLHTHSNYSDGKNSVEEMIETAIDLGYDAIGITDHVWITSGWVNKFSQHINRLKEKYKRDINVYSGLEAKVLNLKGEIDSHHSFDQLVDFTLGSIHRIPFNGGFYNISKGILDEKEKMFENWYIAFNNMLKNPRVDIVAHPLAELKRFNIELEYEQKIKIAKLLIESEKVIEINVRHKAPDDDLIQLLKNYKARVIFSSDSHSIEDLKRYFPQIYNYYSSKEFNIADLNSL